MRPMALALLALALGACAKQGSDGRSAAAANPNAEASIVYFAMPG